MQDRLKSNSNNRSAEEIFCAIEGALGNTQQRYACYKKPYNHYIDALKKLVHLLEGSCNVSAVQSRFQHFFSKAIVSDREIVYRSKSTLERKDLNFNEKLLIKAVCKKINSKKNLQETLNKTDKMVFVFCLDEVILTTQENIDDGLFDEDVSKNKAHKRLTLPKGSDYHNVILLYKQKFKEIFREIKKAKHDVVFVTDRRIDKKKLKRFLFDAYRCDLSEGQIKCHNVTSISGKANKLALLNETAKDKKLVDRGSLVLVDNSPPSILLARLHGYTAVYVDSNGGDKHIKKLNTLLNIKRKKSSKKKPLISTVAKRIYKTEEKRSRTFVEKSKFFIPNNPDKDRLKQTVRRKKPQLLKSVRKNEKVIKGKRKIRSADKKHSRIKKTTTKIVGKVLGDKSGLTLIMDTENIKTKLVKKITAIKKGLKGGDLNESTYYPYADNWYTLSPNVEKLFCFIGDYFDPIAGLKTLYYPKGPYTVFCQLLEKEKTLSFHDILQLQPNQMESFANFVCLKDKNPNLQLSYQSFLAEPEFYSMPEVFQLLIEKQAFSIDEFHALIQSKAFLHQKNSEKVELLYKAYVKYLLRYKYADLFSSKFYQKQIRKYGTKKNKKNRNSLYYKFYDINIHLKQIVYNVEKAFDKKLLLPGDLVTLQNDRTLLQYFKGLSIKGFRCKECQRHDIYPNLQNALISTDFSFAEFFKLSESDREKVIKVSKEVKGEKALAEEIQSIYIKQYRKIFQMKLFFKAMFRGELSFHEILALKEAHLRNLLEFIQYKENGQEDFPITYKEFIAYPKLFSSKSVYMVLVTKGFYTLEEYKKLDTDYKAFIENLSWCVIKQDYVTLDWMKDAYQTDQRYKTHTKQHDELIKHFSSTSAQLKAIIQQPYADQKSKDTFNLHVSRKSDADHVDSAIKIHTNASLSKKKSYRALTILDDSPSASACQIEKPSVHIKSPNIRKNYDFEYDVLEALMTDPRFSIDDILFFWHEHFLNLMAYLLDKEKNQPADPFYRTVKKNDLLWVLKKIHAIIMLGDITIEEYLELDGSFRKDFEKNDTPASIKRKIKNFSKTCKKNSKKAIFYRFYEGIRWRDEKRKALDTLKKPGGILSKGFYADFDETIKANSRMKTILAKNWQVFEKDIDSSLMSNGYLNGDREHEFLYQATRLTTIKENLSEIIRNIEKAFDEKILSTDHFRLLSDDNDLKPSEALQLYYFIDNRYFALSSIAKKIDIIEGIDIEEQTNNPLGTLLLLNTSLLDNLIWYFRLSQNSSFKQNSEKTFFNHPSYKEFIEEESLFSNRNICLWLLSYQVMDISVYMTLAEEVRVYLEKNFNGLASEFKTDEDFQFLCDTLLAYFKLEEPRQKQCINQLGLSSIEFLKKRSQFESLYSLINSDSNHNVNNSDAGIYDVVEVKGVFDESIYDLSLKPIDEERTVIERNQTAAPDPLEETISITPKGIELGCTTEADLDVSEHQKKPMLVVKQRISSFPDSLQDLDKLDKIEYGYSSDVDEDDSNDSICSQIHLKEKEQIKKSNFLFNEKEPPPLLINITTQVDQNEKANQKSAQPLLENPDESDETTTDHKSIYAKSIKTVLKAHDDKSSPIVTRPKRVGVLDPCETIQYGYSTETDIDDISELEIDDVFFKDKSTNQSKSTLFDIDETMSPSKDAVVQSHEEERSQHKSEQLVFSKSKSDEDDIEVNITSSAVAKSVTTVESSPKYKGTLAIEHGDAITYDDRINAFAMFKGARQQMLSSKNQSAHITVKKPIDESDDENLETNYTDNSFTAATKVEPFAKKPYFFKPKVSTTLAICYFAFLIGFLSFLVSFTFISQNGWCVSGLTVAGVIIGALVGKVIDCLMYASVNDNGNTLSMSRSLVLGYEYKLHQQNNINEL
jgi:hypothetical protein